MIFPLSDLVPDICRGLSTRDIRAIACTSRDVHGILVPFMTEIRAEEDIEELRTCHVSHLRLVWPRLHHIIKYEIIIVGALFHTDTVALAPDHTGVVTILHGEPPYRHYNKSYINVRNGMARYGVGGYRCEPLVRYLGEYVYAVRKPIPFVHFVDMFMTYMLFGDPDSGYNSDIMRHVIWIRAHTCGYGQIHKFIGSTAFMEMFAQW